MSQFLDPPPEVQADRRSFRFVDGAWMLRTDIEDYVTSLPKRDRRELERLADQEMHRSQEGPRRPLSAIVI